MRGKENLIIPNEQAPRLLTALQCSLLDIQIRSLVQSLEHCGFKIEMLNIQGDPGSAAGNERKERTLEYRTDKLLDNLEHFNVPCSLLDD